MPYIERKVPSRANPSVLATIERYYIDSDIEPTAVIFGKFIPWTGPNGHGRLLEYAQKHFQQVVIASPGRQDGNALFTNEQRKQIVALATKGVPYLTLETGKGANVIPAYLKTLIKRFGIERPVFIVGPDSGGRDVELLEQYVIPFKADNPAITKESDPRYGKGEYISLPNRGSQQTKGASVRHALMTGDRSGFLHATGYHPEMWDILRKMITATKLEAIGSFVKFAQNPKPILTEGGNAKTDKYEAQPAQLTNCSFEEYQRLASVVTTMLRNLNAAFKAANGKPIWGAIDPLLDSGELFAGSTRIAFGRQTRDPQGYAHFVKLKPQLGDIDILVPHSVSETFSKWLPLVVGTRYGEMIFGDIHSVDSESAITLWVLPDDLKVLSNAIQLDFDYVDYENEAPTPFARLARYSSWQDIQGGIKGAFRRYLLQSIAQLVKLPHAKIATLTPTGQLSSKTYETPSKSALSFKGLRDRYVPAGWADIHAKHKNLLTQDPDKGITTPDGIPVMRPTDTKDVRNYVRDLPAIYHHLFNQGPKTPTDIKSIFSFHRLLDKMTEFLNPQQISDVFTSFVDRLFGSSAEELVRITDNNPMVSGVNKEDFALKMTAIEAFKTKFPHIELPPEGVAQQARDFYSRMRARPKG